MFAIYEPDVRPYFIRHLHTTEKTVLRRGLALYLEECEDIVAVNPETLDEKRYLELIDTIKYLYAQLGDSHG